MTIRPVYERPRVLRTLLCLLVGVLALLWRAVPSFSWSPAACSNVRHSHQMQAYDYAYYCCGTYITGWYPCDAFAVYYYDGQGYRLMAPGTCYCSQTEMNLCTYGDPAYPTHYPRICLRFAATINYRGHCHCYDDIQKHEPGEWNVVSIFYGSGLDMHWG